MHPSRRKILKQLLAGVGVSTAFPSFAQIRSSEGHWAFYSLVEQPFVQRMCDLILPATDTPGAISAGVPQYLDGLFAHWANHDTQVAEHAFLNALARQLKRQEKSFTELPNRTAEQVLRQWDESAYQANTNDELADAYRTFKQRLTQSYQISEAGALEEMDWRATPGRWIPSLPVGEPAS